MIVEGDFLRAREPTILMPRKKPTYPSKAMATAYCFTLPAYSFAESPACAPKEWKHWVDEDSNYQNARNEVQIAKSLIPVGFKTSKGCRVGSRSWNDPFSGKTTITDATKTLTTCCH